MRNLFVLLGVAGLAFAACEKSTPTTTPPPGDTSGPPGDTTAATDSTDTSPPDAAANTEPGAPGVKWADKDRKQRMEHMGIVVLPEMKKLFGAYDSAGFGSFKCDECHGKDAKAVDYKMPNGLYPLDKNDPIKGAMDYDAKITKFMMEQVTPKMAELLDSKPWSPENPTGVGCFTCHPTA